ncbi:MAG: ABC transporter permease [Acidimicrobiales bacterium]
MIAAEFYKIKTQRTPYAVFGAMLAASLAPSLVLVFYTPSATDVYVQAFQLTYSVFAVLLAVVFGGWVLGTEYRQDTVKRMLTAEPRRMRNLWSKAAVGFAVLCSALTTVALVGWSAAWLVGQMNDVGVEFIWQDLLAAGVMALVAAAMSFALSALTRSDAFAMVATTGTLLILDPLLSAIPRFGKYTLGSAMAVVSTEIEGLGSAVADPLPGSAQLGLGAAAVTVALWLAVLVGAGVARFARSDV